MTYTTEQHYEMAEAKKRLNRTGHPSAVTRITVWMEEGRPFSEIQKIYQPVTVKPEVPVSKPTSDIVAPPKSGLGSGTEKWQDFAKEVSDMDHEIIDSMGKQDLITVLKDKGIIDE